MYVQKKNPKMNRFFIDRKKNRGENWNENFQKNKRESILATNHSFFFPDLLKYRKKTKCLISSEYHRNFSLLYENFSRKNSSSMEINLFFSLFHKISAIIFSFFCISHFSNDIEKIFKFAIQIRKRNLCILLMSKAKIKNLKCSVHQ